jgi:CheY-like chemotaxis protein
MKGIHLARERQPNVIITDLVKRTAAGWLIPEHLKADPVTAAIPVIAVTGYVLPDDQERAKRAGVAEFLPKPVDLVRLLRTVKNLVG